MVLQSQKSYFKLALKIERTLQVDHKRRVAREVKAEGLAEQEEQKVVHGLEMRVGLELSKYASEMT